MRVVGLDLSLRQAGVAVVEGMSAEYHTFGYKLGKDATQRDHLERVIHITHEILGVIQKSEIDFVGIEGYSFHSRHSYIQHMQADLGGVVKVQCYLADKIPIILPPKLVRKFILGPSKLNQKGQKIKAIVRKKLEEMGYPKVENLDQSDALAVAHVVKKWAGEAGGLDSIYNYEVFDYIEEQRRSRCAVGIP